MWCDPKTPPKKTPLRHWGLAVDEPCCAGDGQSLPKREKWGFWRSHVPRNAGIGFCFFFFIIRGGNNNVRGVMTGRQASLDGSVGPHSRLLNPRAAGKWGKSPFGVSPQPPRGQRSPQAQPRQWGRGFEPPDLPCWERFWGVLVPWDAPGTRGDRGWGEG